MSENSSAGGCVWRALAEFLCVLTPEQYILLPTLLASNIFCTTSESDQDLLSNFFTLLGSALTAISLQSQVCENRRKAEATGNADIQQETSDQIEENSPFNQKGTRKKNSSNAGDTLRFE